MDMGFKEISLPHYEEKENRGSRILFEVDTYNQGRISFTLTLDSISTFSKIADDHCFEEFGKLSEYLAEEFGVQTQFRLAEADALPEDIRKGAKDEPTDTDQREKRTIRS